MTTTQSRKSSQKVLHEIGDYFTKDFMAMHPLVVTLRAKNPTLCWKAAGEVAYLSISEFVGPNSTQEDGLTLYRLKINLDAPPALFYHLKSPAIRHKLGINQNPLISVSPTLELTATAEEIKEFGRWTVSWLDAQFYQKTDAPKPPIPLVNWTWDGDLNKVSQDFMQMDVNWLNCSYVWTQKAIDQFEDYLRSKPE